MSCPTAVWAPCETMNSSAKTPCSVQTFSTTSFSRTQDEVELDLVAVQPLVVELVEPECLRRSRVELRRDLLQPVDLEGADDDVALAVALRVEERVRHRERNLVAHLRRADRVGVDQ